MTTPKLLHLFVGVPDEMLRSIGLVVVMSSQLDFGRLRLLEAADQIPVTTSARWSRQVASPERAPRHRHTASQPA
jgi:hypothetical protein